MDTLLLDRTTWDVCLDARGNIAIASEPYAIAQDVASSVRLFLGECYYDTSRGVPHFQKILGHSPPLGIFKSALETAALTHPEVSTATVFITGGGSDREVRGQIQLRSVSGITSILAGSLSSPTPA